MPISAWQGATILLLTSLASPAVPQSADDPARRLAQAAQVSLGSPAALRARGAIHLEQSGPYHALEQARSPAERLTTVKRVYRWTFDPVGGRILRDAEQRGFPGGIDFWSRAALGPAGGWNVDVLRWRSGTDLQRSTASEARATRLQWERVMPHLLVRQLLSSASLAAVDPDTIRFTDAAGAVVTVEFNRRTRRPIRAAQDGPQGPSEYRFLDYRRRGGLVIPSRVQLWGSGRLIEDVRLIRSHPARLQPSALIEPNGYAPPPPANPTLRPLAPGLLMFDGMPGGYHSLVVEQGEELLLVEAPLNAASARLQQKLLGERFPGRKVSNVLVTHHHGDHTGGLGEWLNAGATVVLPKGAEVAIARQLQQSGYSGPLRFELVDGRRSFGSGRSRVEAHALDTSHAAAHLLVHLPSTGHLFQGDMFYLPERGPVPAAFPIVAELDQAIRRLALGVTSIVGVHGRAGTLAELQQSLALARR